ncbi:MAG: FliM/FliN family flagellar motor C-terminal domain-containing protein [Phycisphaerae bacterium]|jgi:flagellar motor switch protein FliN/FliY
MLIDQSEIDALLSQADDLATEAALVAPPPPPPPKRTRELYVPNDPEVKRLLRIRVPVIVRLANRAMAVRAVRRLAPGSIIEFEKSVDRPLDLLINNRPIGGGVCVKIGEHFGLRLTQVEDRVKRIQSMGA